MLQNNYPCNDNQIDTALFGLLSEIEVNQVKDLEAGDIN
jgi:hypothetical protein